MIVDIKPGSSNAVLAPNEVFDEFAKEGIFTGLGLSEPVS